MPSEIFLVFYYELFNMWDSTEARGNVYAVTHMHVVTLVSRGWLEPTKAKKF